ncbi:hypothetical protein H2201_008911, partial [Coniosporium apollinis]
SFISFDLESTWSAALVLLIAPVVDPSLFEGKDSSLETAQIVLDEMAAKGNLIAASRRAELEQLNMSLRKLETAVQPGSACGSAVDRSDGEQIAWDVMTQTGSHNLISCLYKGGTLRKH